ncbi:astacin-like metalloprotease toxin 5 [Parasteatoda tepidariorum]|uniref:astacin-like metalloprotease toxin 5 n=1 Tax=Parasteatoda tepidariorum TaxID=114398 RepID=UPI00077FB6FA|nr:astacin-like metalloprotease toxin 5 [Parasteatoda tepidariorum]
MLFFIAFLTLASALENLSVNLGDLPLQNPDLFGGDMLGVDVTDRNAIPQPHLKWPGAKVPYFIDDAISRYTKQIQKAMENYHDNTCVRFVPRTTEANYIRIFAGQGCYSNVGMIGGQQQVSLGQGCMFKGTIVHELGHTLGFFHEQNRSDRDEYLIIYWKNIMTGKDTQFHLMKPHENLILDTFDYNSIMLYGNTAFSKDGRSKTMVAKTGVRLYDTFDKPGLSNSDIIRVKKLYC